MHTSLIYLVHRLTDGETYDNSPWRVTVTKRAVLIEVKWLRQVYVHLKQCELSAWNFTCMA